MNKDPFEKYYVESEPNKAYRGYAWSTGIGLQAVDGLEPSKYLIDTAIQNIEGNLTMRDARELIENYYRSNPAKSVEECRTQEADVVASRIAELLSEPAFSFSPSEYLSIHRKLFSNIYNHAGKFRAYNITKKEWVLDGATVTYGSASELKATLEYDLSQERDFDYKGLDMDEIIHHLAFFVAKLWQIHVFEEGNTRTTAVFLIKYLRTLGFSATNEIFAEHAWYFRNALVRANYNNLQIGLHETTEYLELFLKNLLLGENNRLKNRSMHISGLSDSKEVDIRLTKVDIEDSKVDICNILSVKGEKFSDKTVGHICCLFEKYGFEGLFGRSLVMDLLGLKASGASKFLSKILQADIIEPVSGYGKGKYRFKRQKKLSV